MSFDPDALRAAVARHGRVARVVVAEIAGSTPRDVGTSMLVWDGGQSGTIGGGALEFEAARAALGRPGVSRHPLGPQLGQCCGGSVTLWTDIFEAENLRALDDRAVIARGPGDMPLPVKRLLDVARSKGDLPGPQFLHGWMIEPVSRPSRALWIWGAGHVGRAIANAMAPLPDWRITWTDTGPERFPDALPEAVTRLPAADLTRLVAHAPKAAQHLVLTYSHEIDLALCHALLNHEFAFAGLIGSDTKWARFRKRLAALGHSPARIADITCPIGDPALGKHPQAIALGVATALLKAPTEQEARTWHSHSSA